MTSRIVVGIGTEITEDNELRYVELVERDGALVVEGLIVCDFCGSTNARWSFQAHDIETVDGNVSVGGWAACEGCRTAIENDDRDALARRAQKGGRKLGLSPSLGELRRAHAVFFAARMKVMRFRCRTRPDRPGSNVGHGALAQTPATG